MRTTARYAEMSEATETTFFSPFGLKWALTLPHVDLLAGLTIMARLLRFTLECSAAISSFRLNSTLWYGGGMIGLGFESKPIWLILGLGVFDTGLWRLGTLPVDARGKLLGILEGPFLEGAVLAWENWGV